MGNNQNRDKLSRRALVKKSALLFGAGLIDYENDLDERAIEIK